MKLNKLANAILRGSFLMEERTALGLLPLADRFLMGEKVAFWDDDEEEDPYLAAYIITPEGECEKLMAATDDQRTNIFQGAPAGSIMVIPIQGAIMADDYCGSPGTKTMSSWLLDARASENIVGGILHINSGGGSVEGTAEFAQVISDVAQDMPLEVYTDGMIASAAYWIASAASSITASSGTVEIGSIGTLIRFNDFSEYYSKMGIKQFNVYADKSFDKHGDYNEALAGNQQPLKENVLNPTNEIFHDAVKANRGDKIKLIDVKSKDGVDGEEPITGKMYLAQTAIDLGLIDAIGSLEIVFNNVRTSAGMDTLIANHNNKDMSLKFLTGSKFKTILAAKGKKAADIQDAEVVAMNQELVTEGIDNLVIMTSADFEEVEANADAIETGLTAINAAMDPAKPFTSLSEAIAGLVADRDTEHTRAEEYGDQPGEKPTKVKTKAESEGRPIGKEKIGKEKYMTSVDAELEALDNLDEE